MKSKRAPAVPSIQWLPAERLGQFKIDSNVRPWLIAQGLLSARMKIVCAERFTLRLVEQWSGLLSGAHKLGLRAADTAGLYRDVELCCGSTVWVFAQTVIPDSTLSKHPWLAELGDTPLDEMLEGLSGVERSAYDYAWLPTAGSPGDGPVGANHPLTERALDAADVKPAGLWARRARVALRGAPILMQELFLPATGIS